jgi:tRNA-dihydrouridine synthase
VRIIKQTEISKVVTYSKIGQILKTLVEWKQQTTWKQVGAVGAKIRLGLNAREQNMKVYMGVIDMANVAGIDFLTVHGRNASQKSRDTVSWNAIREVKEIASMPIIGNGDVRSYDDKLRIMNETHCDGVMIARAAIANPWVFNSLSKDAAMMKSESNSIQLMPSLQELEMAQQEYESWGRGDKSKSMKSKYGDFHALNFKRLHAMVLSGGTSSSLNTALPRNEHFS